MKNKHNRPRYEKETRQLGWMSKYRSSACPSSLLYERNICFLMCNENLYRLDEKAEWQAIVSCSFSNKSDFRTSRPWTLFPIRGNEDNRGDREPILDVRTSEISNCSQDTSSTLGVRSHVYLTVSSRRRKTGWPSREMECHVEKVQTVGNLLDSWDNFAASRRILLRDYGNRDFTYVRALTLDPETSNNYREWFILMKLNLLQKEPSPDDVMHRIIPAD